MRLISLLFLILFLVSCGSHQKKKNQDLKLPAETPEGQGIILSTLGICNASLISPTTVLTNSHCLTNITADKLYGIFKTTKEDAFVSFTRIVYQSQFPKGHDFYKTPKPDYAILELAAPLENATPLVIRRTEFKAGQPVFLHSLEVKDDMTIVLQSSKCFTFKNNWDSDYKSGLRHIFISKTEGQKEDCVIKEGYSGTALRNEHDEMIGVLRQLALDETIEGRKQGNLGIVTSMSCLTLYDYDLDKSKDKKCDVEEEPYDRKKEFITLLQMKLDEEINAQMHSLPEFFNYAIHQGKDEMDPKVLMYANTFRVEPVCVHKAKLSLDDHEGELWDFQINIGITMDKARGFGFDTPIVIRHPYQYRIRAVNMKKFDLVIDTPYLKGKPLSYCKK